MSCCYLSFRPNFAFHFKYYNAALLNSIPMKLKTKSLLPTKINDGIIVYSFDFEIEIYVED